MNINKKSVLFKILVPLLCLVILELVRRFFSFLSTDEKVITIIAIIVVLLIVFCIFFLDKTASLLKKKVDKLSDDKVYAKEGRFATDTVGMVKQYLEKHGLNIDGLVFNQKTTIGDLEKHANKRFNASLNPVEIENLTKDARAFAYRNKYSEPNDNDEKYVLEKKFGDWTSFLDLSLLKIGVRLEDYYSSNILDVGFGHGFAYSFCKHFSKFEKFVALDISEKALANSRQYFEHYETKVGIAESLPIETSTIDLYMSFRTFQSTLFDRRAAIHEAERVLKFGGVIVISIPIMYVDIDGEMVQGLSPGYGLSPTMIYAKSVVTEVKLLLQMVGFREVVDSKGASPFEIFVIGRL